ncbi:MAG: hypothetical protein K0S28_2500 [Paucimonas sp.]|jgi:hypothetical protein|nr:hypothetical protein [Paucimonas sp.]
MDQWKIPILIVSIGFNIILSLALINTENQRHALMTRQCEDPLFGGPDKKCLKFVESRPHSWQHWTYALTHILGYDDDTPAGTAANKTK